MRQCPPQPSGLRFHLKHKSIPFLSVVNLGAPFDSASGFVCFPCPLPSAARSALRCRRGFVG